jgi:chloramphenicol 3-O-phosphotransferase
MQNWQLLILSGPTGSGKASVGQKLSQAIPLASYLQVYRSKTSQLSLNGDTAREQALVSIKEMLARGQKVVIDDAIESPQELALFTNALPGVEAIAVTLMPSLEEMERRDALKPIEQRSGTHLGEVYATMRKRLAEASTVLDTTGETVEDTVKRVLDLLG